MNLLPGPVGNLKFSDFSDLKKMSSLPCGGSKALLLWGDFNLAAHTKRAAAIDTIIKAHAPTHSRATFSLPHSTPRLTYKRS